MTKAPDDDRPRGPTIGARVRTWFLTGVVVAGPLAVTGYLVLWFVDTVDNAVRTIVPSGALPDTYLPFHIPGFGVVIAFVGLTLLGFCAANLAGRTFFTIGETLLARMPIVRSIHRGAKQIFETLFSENGSSLRRVGLVEFPMKGQWALVFISSPPTSLVESRLPPSDDARISVFLPCVPNPTTGFYFYLPARDVIELPMSPEDAAKLIMSCGVIQPEGQAALAAMAAGARPASGDDAREPAVAPEPVATLGRAS